MSGETLRFSRVVGALPPVVPFVPPEAFERAMGAPFRVRIGANESNFGPSPKAVAAMSAAAANANWYCDPEGYVLREALAKRHGCRRDNIALAAGADALLGLTVRSFVDAGETVVMSTGGYPTFAFHVNGFGGKLVTVPYRDDRNDPMALAAAARDCGARLVYLANPDNPSGSWLDAEAQLALIAGMPPGCILVLDEAYADFTRPGVLPECDPENPRLIRVRTFSKAHGMAGARLGYAIAPADIVAAFDKIRNHFGVNRMAQEGALASLGDPGFIADVVRQVEAGRRDYELLARDLGLAPLPSMTNFVAIDCGSNARAKAILTRLRERERVFIRMPGMPPLDRCIRVSVGTPPERALFAEALRRVVADLPAV
jgi:histidinol-phosphate aminotransferase